MTCPEVGDSSSKGLIIPRKLVVVREPQVKVFESLREGPVSHQLVGKVTAYQGGDG